ncbi:hypothetical protein Ciccas_007154 [Cichlidogyrus casuarinus]|uniref:Uncharacterized protein n=1 Tax=Cichlidogyrus casuarinus TaxID=1844966 RepID=A0ABD2Q4T8_9PLAT
MSALDLAEVLHLVIRSPLGDFYILRVLQIYAAPLFLNFQHKMERKRLKSAKSTKEITEREYNHLEMALEICSLIVRLRNQAQRNASTYAFESSKQMIHVVKDLKAIHQFYRQGRLNQDPSVDRQIMLMKEKLCNRLDAIVLGSPEDYNRKNRITANLGIFIDDLIKSESEGVRRIEESQRITPISEEVVGFYMFLVNNEEGKLLIKTIANELGKEDKCSKELYDRLEDLIEEKGKNCQENEKKIVKSFLELMTIFSQNNKNCCISKLPNHSQLLMEFLASLYDLYLVENPTSDRQSQQECKTICEKMISNLENNRLRVRKTVQEGCYLALEILFQHVELRDKQMADIRRFYVQEMVRRSRLGDEKSAVQTIDEQSLPLKKTSIQVDRDPIIELEMSKPVRVNPGDETSDIDSIKSGIVRMVSENIDVNPSLKEELEDEIF